MKVQADVKVTQAGLIKITIGTVSFDVEVPASMLDNTLVRMGVRQPVIEGSAVEIHKTPPSGGERKKHGRRGRRA